jgi:pterin-4a-carbinolamine dehydratase
MTQLTEKELEQKVKEAPLWELSPDRKSISRTFVAKNFAEGLKFFNAVAQLAEEWNHHPVCLSTLQKDFFVC